MAKRVRLGRACSIGLVAILLAFALSGVASEQKPLDAVFDKPAPEGASDLRVIEQAARDLAEKLIPCTVGISVGMAQASGVIVSQDGYVLTAAHVAGRPGREVQVKLDDGTELDATTLGIHTEADGGLIKITSEGSWPYAAIVSPDEAPRVGDWCLATGHPSGYQSDRDAPVRLGRVIEINTHVIQTDCAITEGDSGGPLFDMQGRVIGIHSRIAEEVTENLHGPALAFHEAWEQLKAGKIYPARPPSRFLDLLDIDRDGQLTRDELSEGFEQRVFDRLASEFHLDIEKPLSIEELVKDVFQWRASPLLTFGRLDQREDRVTQSLLPKLFVRGSAVKEAFSELASEAGQSTVRVKSDGKWVALGAVVGADGWILTKASQLGDRLFCDLSGGREVAARLVDVSYEHDLAMLRVEADDLAPITWATSGLTAGSWLMTPTAGGKVQTVGVVSVAELKVPRTQAVLGVEIDTNSDKARVRRVRPRSGAADAGMQDGDVITKIMDRDVGSFEELRGALADFRVGDVVRAIVQRGMETVELEVTLRNPEDIFFRFGPSELNGPLSRRRDDFPRVVQHDSTLAPNMCGGPVFDSSGKAAGINIARASRIATYAVPYEALAEFVNKHTSAGSASTDEKP